MASRPRPRGARPSRLSRCCGNPGILQARARLPACLPARALCSGGGGSSGWSRARCDPDPESACRPAPSSWPPECPLIRPQRPPGRRPPWSCWPQPSAPLALWTTTAPPRRATRATRQRDTCRAGEDERAPGPLTPPQRALGPSSRSPPRMPTPEAYARRAPLPLTTPPTLIVQSPARDWG